MLNRRDLLKQLATASAISAAEVLMPGVIFGAPPATSTSKSLAWKKAPCRFCGTGCGLLIGVENDRAVAVKGDPASPVNKGLCCVKGYHSVMALYGADRFKTAYVRKDGKLTPVPVKEALDLVAANLKSTIADTGKDSVAIYGSGQWTIPEGYAAIKLVKAKGFTLHAWEEDRWFLRKPTGDELGARQFVAMTQRPFR